MREGKKKELKCVMKLGKSFSVFRMCNHYSEFALRMQNGVLIFSVQECGEKDKLFILYIIIHLNVF